MFKVTFKVTDESVDHETIEGDLTENLSFDIEELEIKFEEDSKKEGGE